LLLLYIFLLASKKIAISYKLPKTGAVFNTRALRENLCAVLKCGFYFTGVKRILAS